MSDDDWRTLQPAIAPSPAKYYAELSFDRVRRQLVLAPLGHAQSFFELPFVFAIVTDTLSAAYVMRVRDDEHPGERPPPAGVVTPRLLAARLQSRLRTLFPEHDIQILSRRAS